MNYVTPITPELLRSMEEEFDARPELSILSGAISGTVLGDAAFVPASTAKLRMDFSVEVKSTAAANQKQSGRCWMFATMNVIRRKLIADLNLKDILLSGTYLAFYDKLEKANSFFEAILAHADQELDGRETWTLMRSPLPDGGQWDMAVSLIKKYGIVPEWAMPETVHSTGTAAQRDILDRKLREDALELRALARAGEDTNARRVVMLKEIYNALRILYGEPPKTFNFVYSDKDDNYHCDPDLTPEQFRDKYIGDLLDTFKIVNCSPIHPVNRTLKDTFPGNVVEDDIIWLNLTYEETEALAVRMLKEGEPVFFSCDCHPDGARKLGYWDPDCFRYGELLGGMTFGMTKAERMLTGESTMNHCMVLCGVNLDESGQPDRWKIENSWGDASGQKGFFVASEKWMQQNLHQICVKKSMLTEEQMKLFEQEPIALTYWDPLA